MPVSSCDFLSNVQLVSLDLDLSKSKKHMHQASIDSNNLLKSVFISTRSQPNGCSS